MVSCAGQFGLYIYSHQGPYPNQPRQYPNPYMCEGGGVAVEGAGGLERHD